jgi:hypothetical protein
MSLLVARPALWKDDHTINARELMTHDGAQWLAWTIQQYWRKQGKRVTCRVERFDSPGTKGAHYCVRSDMQGGMPR